MQSEHFKLKPLAAKFFAFCCEIVWFRGMLQLSTPHSLIITPLPGGGGTSITPIRVPKFLSLHFSEPPLNLPENIKLCLWA